MSLSDRTPQEPSDFMTALLNALNDFDKRVCALSPSGLMLLPDDDLRLALDARISHEINPLRAAESIEALDTVRRSVYTVDVFDAEVQAYGLEFFLTNESRLLAPLVAEAFREIGAIQHAGLFERFIIRHGINLQLLTESDIAPIRLPLAQFNEAYRQLNEQSPVESLLIAYARDHIEEF